MKKIHGQKRRRINENIVEVDRNKTGKRKGGKEEKCKNKLNDSKGKGRNDEKEKMEKR